MQNGTALLIENLSDLSEGRIVKEDNAEKKYMISGIFMQSEIKNRNGRLYPEHIMDREANKYITEKINTHQGIGELNHPVGEGSLSVNYERTSHKIVSLKKSGKNWLGEAIIANKTPMGSVIAGLMDVGVRVGVSSRATGSLKLGGHGVKIVQEDFRIITPADIVSDPSAPDAFMTSIMEGHEWIYINGALTESKVEDIKNYDNKHAKEIVHDQKRLINVFEWVLNNKIGK